MATGSNKRRPCGNTTCSITNKNSESEIEIQAEYSKRKTASYWLFPRPWSEMAISLLESENESVCLRDVFAHIILLSRTGVKGMHHWD